MRPRGPGLQSAPLVPNGQAPRHDAPCSGETQPIGRACKTAPPPVGPAPPNASAFCRPLMRLVCTRERNRNTRRAAGAALHAHYTPSIHRCARRSLLLLVTPHSLHGLDTGQLAATTSDNPADGHADGRDARRAAQVQIWRLAGSVRSSHRPHQCLIRREIPVCLRDAKWAGLLPAPQFSKLHHPDVD